MAWRFATRIEAIRANRSRRKNIFITFERFARIASNLRFATRSAPKCDRISSVRKPRIDSREWGHLSCSTTAAETMTEQLESATIPLALLKAKNQNHGFSFWFQFPFFSRLPKEKVVLVLFLALQVVLFLTLVSLYVFPYLGLFGPIF